MFSIQQDGACIRLMEAAETLLAQALPAEEAAVLHEARKCCKTRLRTLAAESSPSIFAQIFAASDKINASAGDFSQN